MTSPSAAAGRRDETARWQVHGAPEQGALKTDIGAEAFAVLVWGERVWCGGWDGRIRVWGRAELGAEGAAAGHARVVSALAGWGGYVLSGSADSRIGVWDAESGRSVRYLPGGHSGGVNGLAVRLNSTLVQKIVLVLNLVSKYRRYSEAAGGRGPAAERRRRRSGAGVGAGRATVWLEVRRRGETCSR